MVSSRDMTFYEVKYLLGMQSTTKLTRTQIEAKSLDKQIGEQLVKRANLNNQKTRKRFIQLKINPILKRTQSKW